MHDELKHLKFYRLYNPNELTPNQFLKLENEIKHPKPNIISDEYLDFKLWYKGYQSRISYFSSFINARLYSLSQKTSKEIIKLLEVGCGRTAKLSQLLSRQGYEITCIDPKLELTNCNKIKTIKGEFDYQSFDLSDFDCVIAQEPCAATEHIIRACIEQKVPFIMSLCGVPHTLISGEKPNDVYKWYYYLLDIFPHNIHIEYLSITPLVKTVVFSYSN